jgi:hypothetical protein
MAIVREEARTHVIKNEDVDSLSMYQAIEEAQRIQEKLHKLQERIKSPEFEAKRRQELVETLERTVAKVKSLGFSHADFLLELSRLVPLEAPKKTRAAKGTGGTRKMRADLDATGQGPEIGKTYLVSGTEWTKKPLGATRRIFIDAVKAGQTWAQLEKK